jgi:hypothetical protein
MQLAFLNLILEFQITNTKLRVPKVAYCCFSMAPDITFLWSKNTAESQLKKVIYGLSLHSSVSYPATLGTLSLVQI